MSLLHALALKDTSPEAYINALSIPIPIPSLEYSFRMIVDLNPVIQLGTSIHGAGVKNWISFTGGYFTGSFGNGTVLPGGQDSQTVFSPTHPTAPLSAQLLTRYLLKTDDKEDPNYIEIQTRGWRTGSKDVMFRLSEAAKGNKDVVVPLPEEYKFRLCIEMETNATGPYAHLNQSMWVGSGVRSGSQVIYDAYLVN